MPRLQSRQTEGKMEAWPGTGTTQTRTPVRRESGRDLACGLAGAGVRPRTTQWPQLWVKCNFKFCSWYFHLSPVVVICCNSSIPGICDERQLWLSECRGLPGSVVSNQSMQRDRCLDRGCPHTPPSPMPCVPVCLGIRVLTALSETQTLLVLWPFGA